MTSRSSLAVGLAVLVALAGCETFVEADPTDHTPVLVVSGVFEAGVPWAVRVQRSIALGDTASAYDTGVTGATVEIVSPDGSVLQLPPVGYGAYGATPVDYVGQGAISLDDPMYEDGPAPSPGTTYTLRVSAPGFAPVTATSRAPAPPALLAVDVLGGWEPTGRSDDSFSDARLGVRFAPSPDGAEAYEVSYGRSWVLDDSLRGPRTVLLAGRFYTDAPILRQTTFVDDFGSGPRRRLSSAVLDVPALDRAPDGALAFEITGEIPGRLVLVDLVAGSEAYAEWRRNNERRRAGEENPFAEPVPLYSNVEGGAGVFAGFTRSRAVIERPPSP